MSTSILYGSINLLDYCSGFWDYSDYATTAYAPFLKFTIILIACILTMFVHVLLQPYRKKGLNILDSYILLSLVGLLLSGLEIYWNKMISIIFWFLPLLILINYLVYFTKLKYLIILFTCIAIFSTTFYLSTYVTGFERTRLPRTQQVKEDTLPFHHHTIAVHTS